MDVFVLKEKNVDVQIRVKLPMVRVWDEDGWWGSEFIGHSEESLGSGLNMFEGSVISRVTHLSVFLVFPTSSLFEGKGRGRMEMSEAGGS